MTCSTATSRPRRPNRTWLTDFAYAKTWAGFVYVAFILNVYAPRIVAWHAATTKQTDTAVHPQVDRLPLGLVDDLRPGAVLGRGGRRRARGGAGRRRRPVRAARLGGAVGQGAGTSDPRAGNTSHREHCGMPRDFPT